VKRLCGGAKIFGSALLRPARSVCVSPSTCFIKNCVCDVIAELVGRRRFVLLTVAEVIQLTARLCYALCIHLTVFYLIFGLFNCSVTVTLLHWVWPATRHCSMCAFLKFKIFNLFRVFCIVLNAFHMDCWWARMRNSQCVKLLLFFLFVLQLLNCCVVQLLLTFIIVRSFLPHSLTTWPCMHYNKCTEAVERNCS